MIFETGVAVRWIAHWRVRFTCRTDHNKFLSLMHRIALNLCASCSALSLLQPVQIDCITQF